MQNDYLARVYARISWNERRHPAGRSLEPTIWTYERITETYGDIRGYVKTTRTFAADDDVNGPVYFFRALRAAPKRRAHS